MIALLCWALAQAAAPVAPADPPPASEPAAESFDAVWIQASATLQVTNRRGTADTLIQIATEHGGYFSTLTDTTVVIRVPVEAVPDVLAHAALLGTVVERSYQSQNLTEELRNLQTRLSSRQESLDRYLKVLGEAGADSLTMVGRQVDATIAEIEQIQGRILLLQHQSEFAQLSFQFQFRDRSAPATTGTSSFAWINRLNLADVLRDFRQGSSLGRAVGVTLVPPEGFAPFTRKNRHAAITPDDVKLRTRTFRNKPEATLAFWQEAAQTRFKNAGYRLLGEEDIESKSGKLTLLRLMAPAGDQDYNYWVVIGVHGKRIVVLEVVGEASRFEKREAAIRAALKALTF